MGLGEKASMRAVRPLPKESLGASGCGVRLARSVEEEWDVACDRSDWSSRARRMAAPRAWCSRRRRE